MTSTSWLLLTIALAACAPAQNAPPSSPSSSQQPPPAQGSDGEVIGADREAPSEKLDQGVSVDSKQGVKPAARPTTD